MIYTHKYRLVRADSHGDHGLIETDDWLGKSIQCQLFADVQTVDDFALLRHERYEEFTVVLVRNNKHGSLMVLFNDVDFHIHTFKLMAEHTFVGAQTVPMDLKELIHGAASSHEIFTVV